MASETLQEHPSSQQLAIATNGSRGAMLSPSNEQQDVLRSITTTTTTSNNNGDVSSLAAILTQEDERSPLFVESDDDVGSEPVNSPSSITSPPYWVQVHSRGTSDSRPDERPGTGRHSRAVSNVSFESMLSREAITLQDNEREEDDDDDERPGSRSNVSGRDRNRACWAKSVQITDSVLVNGSATNIGAFVVWNIRVETLNGSYMNIRKRYSEFDDLRRRLVQTFPNFEAAVPVLPPKSVISKFRSKFLEKRRAGLQYFLNCILLNPEFSGSPVLKEFLFA